MTFTYQGRSSGEIFELAGGGKQRYTLFNNLIESIFVTGSSDTAQPTGIQRLYIKILYEGDFAYDKNGLTKSQIKNISIHVYSPGEALETGLSVQFQAPLTAMPHEVKDLSAASRVNYNYRSSGTTKPSGNSLIDRSPLTNDRTVLNGFSWSGSVGSNWWTGALESSPARHENTGTLSIETSQDFTLIADSIIGDHANGVSVTKEPSNKAINIKTSTWSGEIKLNLVAKASDNGDRLDAKQSDFNSPIIWGSLLQGGLGNDQLWGKAGWDIINGGAGNDLIRAGNGRDIITGGLGADELHGDFGWNTFKSEKDGFSDLIAIKSDQFLSNWIYSRAGNNPNGEKADIIEGLDANDQIRIIGVFTPEISVRAGATAHGISGIGIYAGGALEALYTGGDLSVAQLRTMTSGDASAAAMANQVSSYGWTGI